MTSSLGFAWLVIWRLLYYKPEEHARVATQELELIQRGQPAITELGAPLTKLKWLKLLRYWQTWGIVLGRFLIDT